MRNEVVAEIDGRRVVAMDSISLIAPKDGGAIVISGSHGGAISGAFAERHPPILVFFNDAGVGKNEAGVASLAMLEGIGVAAATASHNSAEIGDALDAWLNGVVSRRNGLAAAAGVSIGQSVREAAEGFRAPTSVGKSRA